MRHPDPRAEALEERRLQRSRTLDFSIPMEGEEPRVFNTRTSKKFISF